MMTTISQALNAKLVDLDRFSNNDKENTSAELMITDAKSNSLKKGANSLLSVMPDELEQTIRAARTRAQDNERLKQLIRSNTWLPTHPIRKNLWRCLLQSNSDKENRSLSESSLDDYNKHLNQIFGKSRDIELSLPEFVYSNNPNTTALSIESMGSTSSSSNPNHLNYYNLNHEGRQAIKRILCVFEYQYPQVTYSPGIVSITSLLAHYMEEHEVYQALVHMSSTKEHLIESKSSWDVTSSVFIRLLKNYCKSSYDILTKYATDPVEVILSDWYWWIFDCLSFDYLVKILDCFIFEGQKIVYRVSLAIVQSFTKYLAFVENLDYLNEVNPNGKMRKVMKSQNLKVTKNSIKLFCESPASLESVDKLLKASFSIRNLKRTTIKEYFAKEESKRKNMDLSPISASGSPNQTMALNKLDSNSVKLNVSALSHNQLSPNESDMFTNSPKRIFIQETSTGILSHSHLTTLWNWIPQRLTVNAPSLLFTTEVNGTSMATLFNVLDELEHCILVIKTFDNEIFGAYCSGSWNDRKQKGVMYFGSGETFLFTLQPEKKIFRWVGMRNQSTTSTQELFLRVDLSKIVIGSGSYEGLTISSNLSDGYTNRCETFENDPLCSQQHFQIAVLEVIGFGNSNNRN